MAILNGLRRPIVMIVDWPSGGELTAKRGCLAPIVVRATRMCWLRYLAYSIGCALGLYRRKYDTLKQRDPVVATIGVELSAKAYTLLSGCYCSTANARLELIPPDRETEVDDEEIQL
jgi:hypothetical protein